MKKKKRSFGDITFTVISRLFILLLALSVAFPLIMTVSVSLQTMGEIYQADPVIIPEMIMFENYKTAMSQGNWTRYFLNSAYVTIITVVISLFINSMSGYVFARIPFRFKNALFALILLGMMIPTQVTLIPVFTLLRKLGVIVGRENGLFNTYTGLILPFIAGSVCVCLSGCSAILTITITTSPSSTASTNCYRYIIHCIPHFPSIFAPQLGQ